MRKLLPTHPSVISLEARLISLILLVDQVFKMKGVSIGWSGWLAWHSAAATRKKSGQAAVVASFFIEYHQESIT